MDDYIVADPHDVTSWRASTSLLQCPERCRETYDRNDGAPQFLVLRNLESELPSSGHALHTASWLRRLKCRHCSCYWAICIECISNRTSFRSQKQVRRHWTRSHPPSASLYINEGDNHHEEQENNKRARMTAMAYRDDGDNFPNHQDDEEAALISFPFSGSHNVEYFQRDHVDLGVAYLVAKSQFGSSETSLANDLLKEDVSFQLNLAAFLGSITRGQQRQFAEIMCQYNNLQQLKIVDEHSQSPQHRTNSRAGSVDDNAAFTTEEPASALPQWFSRMPMSFSDLRKVYIEGKNSFLPNLPRPPVQSLNLHDYVSLNDCVADMLAHGLELDDIREGSMEGTAQLSVTKTSQTRRAREIYDNGQQMHRRRRNERIRVLDDQCPPCLYLSITEWSDAFQPSSSIKARTSVWIKTVTISATSDKLHSLLFTYPIAVGEDNANHDEVEERFSTELDQLSSDNGRLFYHGGLKKNVLVYAEIFASLMDQPERRKSNAVLLGGSSFTARWRTCANFALIASKVKACKHCFEKLLDNDVTNENNQQCTDCTCWRTENCGEMLQSDPPAGYPSDVLPEHGKLIPFVMNYNTLHAAVDTTHAKVLQGSWTKDKAHTYLRVHGVNKKSASDVIDAASNCRKLAGSLPGTLTHAALALEAERCPSMYTKWKPPAFWNRNVPMERFIDAPMHLLFLGITKTIVTMIHEWLRLRDQNANFLRFARKAMLLPYKLGLDWCKAIPYGGGRLGGYIAENYLAIARLSGWFYSVLPSMVRHQRVRLHDPPPEDVDKATWTVPQLRKWLFIRGLPNNGNRLILMVRITASYDDQGIPQPVIIPPILPQPQQTNAARGGPARNSHLCVSALQCMLARLMRKSVTEQLALDCERHIFIFLSYFDELDKSIRDRTKQPPTWISSYNFLSLLNLPDVMRMYGPLRNLWEGGGQGEKVLTIVKPTWCGFRNNWRVNMLDRMLRRMAVDRIRAKARHLKDAEESGDNDDDRENAAEVLVEIAGEEEANTQSPNGRNFIMYKSDARVRSDIREGAALSVVRLDSGSFGCMITPTRWLQLKPSRTRLRIRTADDDEVEDEGGGMHITSCCTFFYWTVSTHGASGIPCHDNGVQETITNYCMLLPKLNKEGDPSIVHDEMEDPLMIDGDHDDGEGGIYTLIDSSWDVLHDTEEMTWIIAPPKLSHAQY